MSNPESDKCENCGATLKADEKDYCRGCFDPDAPKPPLSDVVKSLREFGYLEEN